MLLFPFLLLPFASAHSQRPLQDSGEPYSNPLESKEFEKYVKNVLNELHTPGLSIAVLHKNETWAKGFGYSDLQSQKPVTPHTLFFAGSTTKSQTTAAMSKLVYSNESEYADIKWTTPLSSLIREDFVLKDEYATDHITLVDALSHRTGMPRHDISWTNDHLSVREQVRNLRYLPLHNELRTKWEYCNLMFTAVSHAVETVTGLQMYEILRKWIWEPLGMDETFYRLEDALEHEEQTHGQTTMARSYLWDNETQGYVLVPFSDIPPENGAGGVISNVLDYTRWVRQFLYPSTPGNPLSADIVKDLSAPHMLRPTQEPYATQSYGLGLGQFTYRGHWGVGHDGYIQGYMTAMYWIPALEWGFVAFQNSDSFAEVVVWYKLMDDFLDSVGAPGKAYDAKAGFREAERKAEETFKNARKNVYPDAPDVALLGPRLPLPEYEGTYRHPACGNVSLSIAASSQPGADGLPEAPLPLLGVGSENGYLNMSLTMHHVSGDSWWVHAKSGPPSWMTDELLKAKFEVGVDGKVKLLGLQTEPALDGEDGFALFEKIT